MHGWTVVHCDELVTVERQWALWLTQPLGAAQQVTVRWKDRSLLTPVSP